MPDLGINFASLSCEHYSTE